MNFSPTVLRLLIHFFFVVAASAGSAISVETLGQSSRRTSLVFSEVMYHPTNASLEFVELYNSRGEPQDLSGYRLGGDIAYTFPQGTVLPGGGFLVIANSPADLSAAYGITG